MNYCPKSVRFRYAPNEWMKMRSAALLKFEFPNKARRRKPPFESLREDLEVTFPKFDIPSPLSWIR